MRDNRLPVTLSAPRVAATSYCDPGRHANVITPCLLTPCLNGKAPNVGAGASGIWEHREETQRPLHETMRLAEAWLMRHAPGGSMPSQTVKHCKMAILEAPCAQNAPGRSTMRLLEALLPRNRTWESSDFWGLTIKSAPLFRLPEFSSDEVRSPPPPPGPLLATPALSRDEARRGGARS